MISSERIPNNVDLSGNKRLQRALEHWQPKYLQWWRDMGPHGFQDYHQVYVRTAVSVDPEGWANFEYVKLPEYRWGIFLAEPVHDRRIGFGDFHGQPVWQEVPGEFRNQLRRLIVTQGDTEPASVEQQRLLGQRCPSMYDLRNLFQVNVEEGRHLWAMVYLLHSYFGRDGRDEAEELLERQSGNRDKPRILQAFNEPIENWLDFFMFTMFTDRDGKSQLMSLSESSLDPLSRTTRFMLTEEAHHMFVGETGVSRILERTCQLMRQAGFSEDVRKLGGIDIPTVQKHLNQWFSLSLDLHGGEVSSNAASYFANGLKGRAKEETYDDHLLKDAYYHMEFFEDGRPVLKDVLMRNAMNEVLRDWYVGDCGAGVARWNRVLEQHGMSDRLTLPDRKFNRRIGMYGGFHFDPNGVPLSAEEWERRKYEWLPAASDLEYLLSIMAEPVYQPGQFASYIAPPRRGINQLPIDFEYVRTEL
ncbi:MAG TPA: benzoyl-CoA 2,3-epoxidase subunit BoxB [Vicinamibacterales bacterium]|jgi:benzoyl-CoA 2,3-dioxygenase component B|nr:benzoyl-CoA 2,3-epoxidase subunit BoxB [Vicinamibacterales bacterium]